MQHYVCRACHKQFQSTRRPSKLNNLIWKDFVWGKQTTTQLAKRHNKSRVWINKRLQSILPKKVSHTPKPIILVIDATFWSQKDGLLLARASNLKKNLVWKQIETEKIVHYQDLWDQLTMLGYKITAVVIDGRAGVRKLFKDIPVQHCHFHQQQTITKYLTKKPKLQAGIELKLISRKLGTTSMQEFKERLNMWYEQWRYFINEKTYHEDQIHYSYTHKNVRSAYNSLKRNLPYLFTYQETHDLTIPNTQIV